LNVDDAFEEDGDAFLQTFGESITYTPKTGAARTITAVVDRAPARPLRNAQGKLWTPAVTITVRNDATYGVSMAASTHMGGKFTIAKRKGHAETRDHTINDPMPADHDAGMVTFAFTE
jgi:hypothetical protein